MNKRFLLDNDGSNIFHHETDNIERDIEEAVAECSENVTTYLLCSGAGTYYFPTKVGIVDPRSKVLKEAHENNKDPFGMMLKALKKSGMETFITFRMNDVHNPDDADQWNTPVIRREHPECIVDLEAVKSGKADWMCYCMDYSREEVRSHILDIIRELVELYSFDGLQLDWMRFPRHLSGNPEQVWEKRRFITEFTAEVKNILSGANIKLAARIPTTPSGCRYLGMDVAEWTEQDLMDFIVLSPFLTTDFTMPVDDFRSLMGEKIIPIYGGFDFGHGPQIHCRESLKGTISSLFGCGVEGIYMFNFPCWQEYIGSRPFHWLKGLDAPETACEKPLLFSVSHKRHRVSNVDQTGILPVRIPEGKVFDTSLYLPKSAFPVTRSMLLIHSGGDVKVSINGYGLEELPASRRRSELFVEFIDHACQHRPAKEQCRLFRLNDSCLIPGLNTISIENINAHELEIDRINIGVW